MHGIVPISLRASLPLSNQVTLVYVNLSLPVLMLLYYTPPLSLATCFVILDDLPELCSSIRRRLFEATDYVLCVESFRQRDRTGIFKVMTFSITNTSYIN